VFVAIVSRKELAMLYHVVDQLPWNVFYGRNLTLGDAFRLAKTIAAGALIVNSEMEPVWVMDGNGIPF
jgi:hypothetical protein